jgi:DNA-directed RNA polymerase subunit RPC12/RpoP
MKTKNINSSNIIKEFMKTKQKCPRCGYVWESASKMLYVTCPSCRKLFKKE